jgi:hypothetical protein
MFSIACSAPRILLRGAKSPPIASIITLHLLLFGSELFIKKDILSEFSFWV